MAFLEEKDPILYLLSAELTLIVTFANLSKGQASFEAVNNTKGILLVTSSSII